MRPETIDFTGTSSSKRNETGARATSAAWGEIELSPYSRMERGQWIATWSAVRHRTGTPKAMVIPGAGAS